MIEKMQNGNKTYSDGVEIEAEILSIAQKFDEEEIPSQIADDARYLINNTFSPVRKNLLDWYPFREDCTILEVGAGMGSLTGMLCDKAKHVTAVEMSEDRARVIWERCKKRKNLTICCEDILSFEPLYQFDYVVMVGVLEYAAIFSDSEMPFYDFLAKLKSFLKPDGVLLFAIENQFGLKYWIGGSEEHLQKPFVGIQGYQEPKTARTFSKVALEEICSQVGFDTRFYYLLPDYKFPTAIFTDESLPTYHDVRNPKYAYAINSCLTANERELYRDIIQNDVFPFFANAYLVEAAVSLPERQIIRVSARSEVVPENKIITAIDNQGNVFKIPQTKEAAKHIQDTFRNEQRLIERGVSCIESDFDGYQLRSSFCHDTLANEVFSRALETGDYETVKAMIGAMEAALRASSELCDECECNEALASIGDFQGEEILKHGYMDMTFYNAFWSNGELVFFDQEWDFSGLPVRFILYYGLKICYEQTLTKPQIPFAWICDYIRVTEELAQRYDRLEGLLWGNGFIREGDMYGADGYYNQFNVKTYEQLVREYGQMECENRELRDNENVLKSKLICSEGECQQLRDKENNLLGQLNNAETELQQLRDKENVLLGQLSNAQNEVGQLNTQLEQVKNELACREGECQQLRDKENRLKNDLEATRNSRTWRLARKFAGIARFFVPVGSKRALLLRLIWTFIKHPFKFLKNLKPRKIKKFLRTVRNGNMEGAKMLLHSGITGQPAPSQLQAVEPKIVKVETDPVVVKTAADYAVLKVPQWDDPQVSIVIPVYNQFEFTYHCVESIIKNSGDITYEIIIANDCSTDLTTQINEIIPGVNCVTNEQNLRFLRNCNNAAKHAKGQYVLFLNNDTQVQENWLEPLVTLIESADDIGMVGSKLIYPDGLLQEAGGILWKDGSAWNFGNRQNPALPQFNYVKEVDYISGAAVMLSRKLWEEIGGFDEYFVPAYCEDSDLAFTVRKLGYRVMYQPLSVVVHFEGVSNGTDTSTGQKKYQVDNSIKFREKWAEELAKHPDNGVDVFTARDRSYGKKTVLMIDHYVPMYDKDAGSRTIFQYIELLVEMGYNVKFIGDNFFAHQPYTTELEQMGVEVLYGVECMQNWKSWVLENADKLDVVFMNRPHISEKYMDFIKENTKARIIYNLCDLHFLREQREFEITGDVSLKESAEHWKSRELDLIEKADRAFSLSTDEQKILNQYFPEEKTVICPIFIFDHFVDKLPERTGTQDLLFVGGFRHTPNVDAMEWFCQDVFPMIQKEIPDIKLHIVGSNPPTSIEKFRSEHIILEGFVSDERLEELYRQCKVCVIPLRYGAGVKGKTIEAMYNGIPIVTTAIGIEGLPEIEKCITAYNDGQDFAAEVVRVYREGDDGSAQRCYDFVRNHYSRDSAREFFREEFV